MPLEVLAEITASVTSSEPPRTIDAYMEDLSPARTLDTDLSTLYRDAFDSLETQHGYRVKLNGVNVVPWIVGAVEHRRDGYTGKEELRFTITGYRWSIWQTELTSTMLAPVVLEVQHGRNAAEMVADDPVFFRITQADQRGDDEHHVLVDVVCLDELTARARTAEFCFAVPPLAGRSVGSILNQGFAGIPIPSDIPDGRIFTGRIQETGTEFLSRTRELMKTQGWYPRTPGGVVKVGTMEPRPADEQPDWKLDPRRWGWRQPLDAGAPSEVPFRYVLRGETSVEVTDGGVEVIREILDERGLFAPEYIEQVQVGGIDNPSTVPFPVDPPTATDRLISRIDRTREIRQGRPEKETVKEFGWDWTERALAVYQPSGNKLDYYGGAYVDADGNGRTTPVQRFKLIRTTTTRWTYGASGEETKRVVSVTEDVKRDKPTLAPNNPDSVVAVAYLYGDGRSYADQEVLQDRLSEEITYRTSYGASGRKVSETAVRFAYYLRSARSSGAPGSTTPSVLLNGDGNGQVQGTAFFQKTDDSQTTYFNTDSGQRVGEVTDYFGWRVRPNQQGIYEVDGVKTDDAAELYGKLSQKRETTRNRRITKTQTEVTTWNPGELPKTLTVLAPLPISPGVPSTWTTTQTQPLERYDEDSAILARYGANVRVIQSDFADSPEVLEQLLEQAQRRDRSIQATVQRRLSPIDVGDTVDIFDPSAGMRSPRRALCIYRTRRLLPGLYSESLDFEVSRFPE